MKMLSYFFVLLTAFLFVFSSCSKEEEISVQSTNLETSEDLTNFLDVLDAEEDYYAEYVENFTGGGEEEVIIRNDCVTVTFAEPKGSFPNTITLDFGDGCEGPKGRTRSGMIIITQSAAMHEDGATRTSSFVDFYIDEVQLVGSKTLTNLGLNDQGNKALNRRVEGFGLVYPDGSSASFSADHTLTQIAGADTDHKFDNVFAITGSSEGINRMGKSFSSLITKALIKKRACRWIVAGIKQISIEAGTISIDYGDGLCNPVALATTPDGSTKEIHLFKKWWK